MVEKGIGAPALQDSGVDTRLGPSEPQRNAPFSELPEASKASQNNDVDIFDFDETPGPFEGAVKMS